MSSSESRATSKVPASDKYCAEQQYRRSGTDAQVDGDVVVCVPGAAEEIPCSFCTCRHDWHCGPSSGPVLMACVCAGRGESGKKLPVSVHTGDAADCSRLCIAPPQRLHNFPNCTFPHSQKIVCGTTRLRRRERPITWQSPKLPPDVLQAGLGRASTRQLSQPPARGDWVLPRYSRRPHHPTPISVSDFRKFKNTTHKVRSCHLMVYYVIRRNAKQWSGKGEDGDRNERGVTANAITAGDVAPLCTVVDMCELWMSSQCCRIPLAVENTVCR